MDMRHIVGANVKRLREGKKLSQEKLGFKSDLHRTYISDIERAERNATVVIIKRLADALDVRPYELLMDDKDRKKLGRPS
ncbi:MAG: helix-turn-helix domain-containing protein [Rhizobiaceae bacterium]